MEVFENIAQVFNYIMRTYEVGDIDGRTEEFWLPVRDGSKKRYYNLSVSDIINVIMMRAQLTNINFDDLLNGKRITSHHVVSAIKIIAAIRGLRSEELTPETVSSVDLISNEEQYFKALTNAISHRQSTGKGQNKSVEYLKCGAVKNDIPQSQYSDDEIKFAIIDLMKIAELTDLQVEFLSLYFGFDGNGRRSVSEITSGKKGIFSHIARTYRGTITLLINKAQYLDDETQKNVVINVLNYYRANAPKASFLKEMCISQLIFVRDIVPYLTGQDKGLLRRRKLSDYENFIKPNERIPNTDFSFEILSTDDEKKLENLKTKLAKYSKPHKQRSKRNGEIIAYTDNGQVNPARACAQDDTKLPSKSSKSLLKEVMTTADKFRKYVLPFLSQQEKLFLVDTYDTSGCGIHKINDKDTSIEETSETIVGEKIVGKIKFLLAVNSETFFKSFNCDNEDSFNEDIFPLLPLRVIRTISLYYPNEYRELLIHRLNAVQRNIIEMLPPLSVNEYRTFVKKLIKSVSSQKIMPNIFSLIVKIDQNTEDMDSLIAQLPRKYAEVCERHFKHNQSIDSISSSMNMGRSQVSVILKCFNSIVDPKKQDVSNIKKSSVKKEDYTIDLSNLIPVAQQLVYVGSVQEDEIALITTPTRDLSAGKKVRRATIISVCKLYLAITGRLVTDQSTSINAICLTGIINEEIVNCSPYNPDFIAALYQDLPNNKKGGYKKIKERFIKEDTAHIYMLTTMKMIRSIIPALPIDNDVKNELIIYYSPCKKMKKREEKWVKPKAEKCSPSVLNEVGRTIDLMDGLTIHEKMIIKLYYGIINFVGEPHVYNVGELAEIFQKDEETMRQELICTLDKFKNLYINENSQGGRSYAMKPNTVRPE